MLNTDQIDLLAAAAVEEAMTSLKNNMRETCLKQIRDLREAKGAVYGESSPEEGDEEAMINAAVDEAMVEFLDETRLEEVRRNIDASVRDTLRKHA